MIIKTSIPRTAASKPPVLVLALMGMFLFISPAAGGNYFTNDLGMKFVYIQPGTFMMGSNESAENVANNSDYSDKPGSVDRFLNEHPLHQVVISKPFYIQVSEVTVGQWRAFVAASRYKSGSEKEGWAWFYDAGQGRWIKKEGLFWDNPGFQQNDDSPVTCISWNDAQDFINWLSKRDKRLYRLPTEAEWEYACRAGTETPFYWGDKPDGQYANFADLTYSNISPQDEYVNKGVDDGQSYTSSVGTFLPNQWGLYDMSGNVWEWCSDWYGDFLSGIDTDPTGPSSGSHHVCRGGSWGNDAGSCRSAFRGRGASGSRYCNQGLRLCASAVR